MIFYSVLFISFFLVALVIRSARSAFYALAEHSVALVDELIADLDDEAKIKLVQKGTTRLVVSLLRMVLVIIAALTAGSIPVALFCIISGTGFHDLVFSSFYSILSISLGATIPFLLPMGKKNDSDYSELSRLLHRMALDNYHIANRLFRQESRKMARKKVEKREDFVVISGLARAGTTSLMNDLSRISDFVSLSYANMPFLMCPNLWAKVYRPGSGKQKERSHRDGIMIGLNSNEALEEFFFKVKANDAYIHDSCLSEYAISREDYGDYLDYQRVIRLDNRKVYLAKNNNFMLRYRSVRSFNEDFVMVILYRDPLTHASSLLEKHREYKKMQEADPFVLEYMNWLGHHEFGMNQKQFIFSQSNDEIRGDQDSLDYWLGIWINYYRYALTVHHPRTIFINYEAYCHDPTGTLGTILRVTGVAADPPALHPFHNRREAGTGYSNQLHEAALEIYRQLDGMA